MSAESGPSKSTLCSGSTPTNGMSMPASQSSTPQHACKSTSTATDLFKLMISGDEDTFRERVYDARQTVFGADGDAVAAERHTLILLCENFLDQFSLARGKRSRRPRMRCRPTKAASLAGTRPPRRRTRNRRLHARSLIRISRCLRWSTAGRVLAFSRSTTLISLPRLFSWFGVAEYLFRSRGRLDAAIHAAIHDLSLCRDDVEFVIAARGWSHCVSFGFELYRRRFTETRAFFESRFDEVTLLGSQQSWRVAHHGILAL
jgi:prephenate dehydrogenase (NADP+)